MNHPSAPNAPCFLLPRICDTVRLRFCRQCAAITLSDPAPCCFQFESGCLCAAPQLEELRLMPQRNCCGACLHGTLCLPVSLRLCKDCEAFTLYGMIRLPVQTTLRTMHAPGMQYIVQAELCLADVQTQDGCLCALFDLTATLYAVQLQPVHLPVSCAPCPPERPPYFNLPLYPQLPQR